MKNNIPAISLAFGILATFATIFIMSAGVVRTACLIIFSLLTFGSFLGLLSQNVDWLSAWSNLSQLKCLGIRWVYSTGEGKSPATPMANAKNIRIMAVSANALIRLRKKDIINALREQRAFIRILLAQPNLQFVSDVEETESPHRLGKISDEIYGVEGLLSEYVEEAMSGRSTEEVGKVKIGYYTTHLRSSLILCDDSWGWLTLNLPPKRAVQSPSLELSHVDKGLLEDCIKHFDRCWKIVEERGQSLQVLPKRESVEQTRNGVQRE